MNLSLGDRKLGGLYLKDLGHPGTSKMFLKRIKNSNLTRKIKKVILR